jgi:hypothetical protein
MELTMLTLTSARSDEAPHYLIRDRGSMAA